MSISWMDLSCKRQRLFDIHVRLVLFRSYLPPNLLQTFLRLNIVSSFSCALFDLPYLTDIIFERVLFYDLSGCTNICQPNGAKLQKLRLELFTLPLNCMVNHHPSLIGSFLTLTFRHSNFPSGLYKLPLARLVNCSRWTYWHSAITALSNDNT